MNNIENLKVEFTKEKCNKMSINDIYNYAEKYNIDYWKEIKNYETQ